MLKQRTLENIVGKRENHSNQHFLLFTQCFLPYEKQNSSLLLSSTNVFNFAKAKILSFGKELK